MSAPITFLEMPTQDRGPAVPDGSQGPQLRVRQYGSPASQKLFFMGAEDIGQFRPMWFHRGTESRSRSNESRGLGVDRIDTSATCR